MPWNPRRHSIRPELEVAELIKLAQDDNWSVVVERAREWLNAWPEHFPPYEFMFLGLAHDQGIPQAEAWARRTLPHKNGKIRGYLSAAIVLHVLTPARVGDWS